MKFPKTVFVLAIIILYSSVRLYSHAGSLGKNPSAPIGESVDAYLGR